MGGRHFNFAPNFPQMGDFQPDILHVLKANFSIGKNLGGMASSRFCHDAAGRGDIR